jgi:hypothetical protein
LIEQHLPGELISAEIALLDGQPYPFIICGRSRGAANECIEMGAALPAMCLLNAPAKSIHAAAACRAVGRFGLSCQMMLSQRDQRSSAQPRPMGGITPACSAADGPRFQRTSSTRIWRPPLAARGGSPARLPARAHAGGRAPCAATSIWLGGSLDPRDLILTRRAQVQRATDRSRAFVLDSWRWMRYRSLLDLQRCIVSIHRGIPVY